MSRGARASKRRGSSTAIGLLPLCCGLFGIACDAGSGAGSPGARSEAAAGSAALDADVVSVVDGSPIRVHEVQRVVNALGLPPKEALRRLQRQHLLAGEARRLGLQHHPAVRRVKRQAAVQALLETRVESVEIDQADVSEAYERQRDRFQRPEKRASVHVLARVDESAFPSPDHPTQPPRGAGGRDEPQSSASEALDARAHALAEEAVKALQSEDDVQRVIRDYAARDDADPPVAAERIRPIARDAAFAEPYLEAVFSLPKPGVVPEPVRTQFGWHAIAVTEIQPAETTSLAEASETLRSELRVEAEKERMDALLHRLRSGAHIEREASTIRRLLSKSLGADGR